MADVKQGPWGAAPKRKLQPFNVLEPMRWDGVDVPPRRWMVADMIPRGAVTMFTGDGGVGKSLLAQQLLTAAALGKPWLDMETAPCRGLGVFCEDDPEELHRRQAAICEHYGATLGDLEHVNLASRVGMDNVLMDFDRRNDHGSATALFDQLLRHAKEFGAQLIVFDTAADGFSGNENIRPQVRQFVNLLRNLALAVDGAVVLTAHPSVAGMTTGTGVSGSTAWSNTVRQRAYLTRPEGDDVDPNERVLKTMKANYGRVGDTVRLRWKDGVFERLDPPMSPDNMVDRLEIDNAIVDAVRELVTTGTRISADRNNPRSGFPNVLRTVQSCREMTFGMLLNAQARLIKSGRLIQVEVRTDSRRIVPSIRTPDTRYPGEQP